MNYCRWHFIESLRNSTGHVCSINDVPPIETPLTPPPSPAEPGLPSPIPDPWGIYWAFDTIRAATPWAILLTMLFYLLWEVWNVYTDYYGCEQICKLRKDEGPISRNPGEHLMNNLQGSKAMLMDSLKKKDAYTERDNECDAVDDLNSATLKPRVIPKPDPNSLPVSRQLDFSDVPVMLRLRKHQPKWPERESNRMGATGFEKGFVPKTIAKLNSGNFAMASFYDSHNEKFLYSDDEDMQDEKWLYKLWDDY